MVKIRVLILSYEPWDDTNSFGSSYSSIWQGMDGVEIANIYCRSGEPNNKIVKKYFQITEKSIIRSIWYGEYSGKKVFYEEKEGINADILSEKQWKIINWVRNHRLQIFFWARDLIWMTKKWKSPKLIEFVEEFSPDIIWIPIYYSTYLNDIAVNLQKLTKKKEIGYISDDNYSLKQFSISPFFWIDRFIKRPYIRRVIKNCEFIYVITEKQKFEYEKIFSKECKLLWKGADFSGSIPSHTQDKNCLHMIFIGNLGMGRWKSLLEVAELLEKVSNRKIHLDIYTMTPLTEKIKNRLNKPGISRIMPFLPPDDVDATLQNADILLHVESRNLKYRLMYRLSFSTKIVDYLKNAGCILAYGGMTGSMDYLVRNNVGIVACNKEELEKQLIRIMNEPEVVEVYRNRAWECGKNKHEIRNIQNSIYEDLVKVKNS